MFQMKRTLNSLIESGRLIGTDTKNPRNHWQMYTSNEAFKEKASAAGADTADEGNVKKIYLFLTEMNDYITLQFRIIEIYHEIYQKMLAAIYRMQLSGSGGRKVDEANVEAGFFDDLPARFEKLVVNLKTQFGF